jgi:hypothetical protein
MRADYSRLSRPDIGGNPAARIRCGSSAINARRSSPVILLQRVISGSVRPQPKQRLVLGSSMQTAMHGVS